MHPTLVEQLEYNRKTRQMSESYAEHRRRVTELLLSVDQSKPEDRPGLTIFGAGNLNDIESAVVGRRYSPVVLIDIDHRALEFAAGKLERAGCKTVPCHQLDLSGIYSELESAKTARSGIQFPPTAEALISFSRASHIPDGIPKTACVLSSCVLSQLIHAVVRLTETNQAKKIELITELRRKHITSMLECLKPGGRALLISDFVSSDTLPELHYLSESQMPSVLGAAIERGNFFTGCNPFAIYQQIKDMERQGLLTSAGWGKPWTWNISAKRMAVAPFWFQKPNTHPT